MSPSQKQINPTLKQRRGEIPAQNVNPAEHKVHKAASTGQKASKMHPSNNESTSLSLSLSLSLTCKGNEKGNGNCRPCFALSNSGKKPDGKRRTVFPPGEKLGNAK